MNGNSDAARTTTTALVCDFKSKSNLNYQSGVVSSVLHKYEAEREVWEAGHGGRKKGEGMESERSVHAVVPCLTAPNKTSNHQGKNTSAYTLIGAVNVELGDSTTFGQGRMHAALHGGVHDALSVRARKDT